jgi:predicted membrane channel-forming protein YqfA (hemolysin III family)
MDKHNIKSMNSMRKKLSIAFVIILGLIVIICGAFIFTKGVPWPISTILTSVVCFSIGAIISHTIDRILDDKDI